MMETTLLGGKTCGIEIHALRIGFLYYIQYPPKEKQSYLSVGFGMGIHGIGISFGDANSLNRNTFFYMIYK